MAMFLLVVVLMLPARGRRTLPRQAPKARRMVSTWKSFILPWMPLAAVFWCNMGMETER